jgi:hypothetical protein
MVARGSPTPFSACDWWIEGSVLKAKVEGSSPLFVAHFCFSLLYQPIDVWEGGSLPRALQGFLVDGRVEWIG